jgi:hypothetical protein
VSGPLTEVRRRLAQEMYWPDLVPQNVIAVLCDVGISTWRRGEDDPRTLTPRSVHKICKALQRLGIPLTPNHLMGYETFPLSERPPTKGLKPRSLLEYIDSTKVERVGGGR